MKDRAGLRGAAVDEIGGRRRRRLLELRDFRLPVGAGLLHDREPVLRVPDGRRQQVRELHRAVLFEQRDPAVERAGHGDRLHAGHRHRRVIFRDAK